MIRDITQHLLKDNQAFTKKFPEYKKKYPQGADLSPLSNDHENLLKYLLLLANESQQEIQKRYPAWKALDEKLTAYIRLDDDEKAIKATDDRKPVSMVVPSSFAILDTLMTYDVAAFLRQPLIPYDYTGPEDVLGTIMMERVVNQNLIRSKAALEMFTMLRDNKVYGFGGAHTGWRRDIVKRTVRNESMLHKLTGGLFSPESLVEERIKFEGNTLDAFDPYNVLPDKNVPVQYVQRGTSFGWVAPISLMNLLLKEEQGEYFNVKYVKGSWVGKSKFFNDTSTKTGRYTKTGLSIGETEDLFNRTVHLMHYYVKLVPNDFGLGSSTSPELWLFTVAGDRVIVRAKRVDLNHGMIPVGIIATNSDGHTIFPASVMEIDYPMQQAIDWMWASHVGNVRKAVHNMLVVDPQIINMNDVVDTTWGMIARVRPSHWGRGVRDGIMQLPVADVTRQHPMDIGFMMSISNRITAATDQAQGIQQRGGERVSATEAQDTRTSQLSRLEMKAHLASLQGISDIGYQFMSDVNQFLTEDRYVKATGRWEEVLRREYGIGEDTEFLKVSPSALDVDADVLVKDGTIPERDLSQAWQLMMQEARTNPELVQSLDSVRVWLHMARKLGMSNPEMFLRKSSMRVERQDENLDAAVQQGNAVPADVYAEEGGKF